MVMRHGAWTAKELGTVGRDKAVKVSSGWLVGTNLDQRIQQARLRG